MRIMKKVAPNQKISTKIYNSSKGVKRGSTQFMSMSQNNFFWFVEKNNIQDIHDIQVSEEDYY